MSSIRLDPERMVFHLVAVAAEVYDWNDSPHSPVYVISLVGWKSLSERPNTALECPVQSCLPGVRI